MLFWLIRGLVIGASLATAGFGVNNEANLMKNKLVTSLIFLALTLAPARAAVRYVNLANPSPAPPYTNWATQTNH